MPLEIKKDNMVLEVEEGLHEVVLTIRRTDGAFMQEITIHSNEGNPHMTGAVSLLAPRITDTVGGHEGRKEWNICALIQKALTEVK